MVVVNGREYTLWMLLRRPLVTRPLVTRPLVTRPLVTRPLITQPRAHPLWAEVGPPDIRGDGGVNPCCSGGCVCVS